MGDKYSATQGGKNSGNSQIGGNESGHYCAGKTDTNSAGACASLVGMHNTKKSVESGICVCPFCVLNACTRVRECVNARMCECVNA